MSINEQDIQKYHYDAKFNVEVGKFLGKLHEVFSHLSEDCISQIKYERVNYSTYKGYNVKFNNNVGRRYLMDKKGAWHETPNLMNWWLCLGYPVTDDTLESFKVDIQTEFYWKGK
ncbi:hypothetical protein [Neobacillus vireti]|nr:hypothetical protein [Neobacillus vireti]KLT15900.1 hypothetical protein AA980_22160 [Neobacillus vireti]